MRTFGLRDVTITDASGSEVDLPDAQELAFTERVTSGELRGDDVTKSAQTYSDALEFEVGAGGLSLEAYQAMTGHAVSAGASQSVLTGRGRVTFPRFRLQGTVIEDETDRQTRAQFWRCRLRRGFEGEFADGAFLVGRMRGVCTAGPDGVFTLTSEYTGVALAAYIGTQARGVYYANPFNLSGAQSTFTPVNAGLPSLGIYNLDVDAFAPATYQYLTTIVETAAYRRTGGGAGEAILTPASASVLVADTVDEITWVTSDQGVEGRIWAIAVHYASGGDIWFLHSDDRGDTWDFYHWRSNYIVRGSSQLYANDQSIWATYSGGISSGHYISYSVNGGNTFNVGGSARARGFGVWEDWLHIADKDLATYYAREFGDWFHKGTSSSQNQVLIADIAGVLDLSRPLTMWSDSNDANHMRVLRQGELFETFDAWNSVVDTAPSAFTPGVSMQILAPDGNTFVYGFSDVDGDTASHCLYVENAGVLVGRAGNDPENVDTITSIPWDALGPCYDGIQLFDVG